MISRFITFFIFVICIYTCVPTISFGQNLDMLNSDVSIGVYPESPQPNQPVTVTIETYEFNLDASNTTWYVNNTLAQEGRGLKTLTFQTRDIGQPSVVRILIDSPRGQIVKNITITPNIVTILWEAQTYTPPFFKGKALFSHQSTVTLLAQPQLIVGGKALNPANLTYKWTKNGTVLGNQSGYGRQTLTLDGSVISRNLRILVEVEDPRSGAIASGVVDVAPVEPEILTYVVDPLYGIQYNKAITGKLPLTGREVTLTAVPYSFSDITTTDRESIYYNWSINGDQISDGLNTRTRVFRKVGDVFGISTIGLRVEHNDRLLQFASQNISIDFLNTPSNQ